MSGERIHEEDSDKATDGNRTKRRAHPSRKELGYLIFKLQQGESLGLPFSRPMPDVSKGVSELRVRGADGIYRAFYFLKVEDQVLVFHAFKKKTQSTPPQELKLGAKRLKEIKDCGR